MDTLISFGHLAGLLKAYGPFGIVVVIWYIDVRQLRKMAEQYRADMTQVMNRHEKFMEEIRRMYESNVKLVDAYEDLASDLKDVVIMNTQAMTRVCDDISQNQFCPALRVDKKTVKVVEPCLKG